MNKLNASLPALQAALLELRAAFKPLGLYSCNISADIVVGFDALNTAQLFVPLEQEAERVQSLIDSGPIRAAIDQLRVLSGALLRDAALVPPK
jgi:hypothetical protein